MEHMKFGVFFEALAGQKFTHFQQDKASADANQRI
jgi:hypothetical protein